MLKLFSLQVTIKKPFVIDLHTILSYFYLEIHLTTDIMDIFYRTEYKHNKLFFVNETSLLNYIWKVKYGTIFTNIKKRDLKNIYKQNKKH